MTDRVPWAVIIALTAVLVAFVFAGLWWWVAFWATIVVVLGIFEVVAVRKTGRTLSGQFLDWSREHPYGAALLVSVLAGFVGFLIFHLVTGR